MAAPKQSKSAPNDSPADDVILIKKYANRRLYHTKLSSYVTLDDLSQMVRNSEDFIVQDAKTGEDLTRSVLTQIIFDAENGGQMMLPTNFLREIIRLYGDSMQTMVPGYLENAMHNFLAQAEDMRSSFESNLVENPAMKGFENLAKMNQDWMSQTMKMFGATAEKPNSTTPEDTDQREDELDNMKQQLAEMQVKISKLSGEN